MELLWSVLLIALVPCSWAFHVEAPVAKCKDPMPSIPNFDYARIEGTVYDYIYTPDVNLYRMVDNIKMVLKRTSEPRFYKEDITAKPLFGAVKDMKFETEDIGNGVLKKTENGVVYYASVTAVEGELGLLYVCSNDVGKEGAHDSLYVIGRTAADVQTTKDPSVIFKNAFNEYNFNAKFHKLPRHTHAHHK